MDSSQLVNELPQVLLRNFEDKFMVIEQDEWPLLVIVPASLRLTWAEELERWLPHLRPSSVHVIQGKVDRLDAKANPQVESFITSNKPKPFQVLYYRSNKFGTCADFDDIPYKTSGSQCYLASETSALIPGKVCLLCIKS